MGSKDTYWSDILDSGTLACYRSGAMPIESHISQRLLTDSTTNATKWQHKDFDALYQQAQSTRDKTERAAVYERMQRRLHAEGGFLIWGFADWIVGTAPRRSRASRPRPPPTRSTGRASTRSGSRERRRSRSFVARRLLLGVAQTVAVVLLVFALTEALPGDAAVALAGDQPDPARIAAIREAMHLDRPVARTAGRLGARPAARRLRHLPRPPGGPVSGVLADGFGPTLLLAALTVALLVPVGVRPRRAGRPARGAASSTGWSAP